MINELRVRGGWIGTWDQRHRAHTLSNFEVLYYTVKYMYLLIRNTEKLSASFVDVWSKDRNLVTGVDKPCLSVPEVIH